MSEEKKRYKACKRIFKYVGEAIKKLEKAETENTEWQFVPSEVFEEIISVLGKIGTEVTKSEAIT
jgi:hypothetical protein